MSHDNASRRSYARPGNDLAGRSRTAAFHAKQQSDQRLNIAAQYPAPRCGVTAATIYAEVNGIGLSATAFRPKQKRILICPDCPSWSSGDDDVATAVEAVGRRLQKERGHVRA